MASTQGLTMENDRLGAYPIYYAARGSVSDDDWFACGHRGALLTHLVGLESVRGPRWEPQGG